MSAEPPFDLDPEKGSPLLVGVVGSHAYGMARPDSDTDRLGVYAAPTRAFHGLHAPVGRAATVTSTGPDWTMHEAGKLAALCLAGNPTVMELLWLPEHEFSTTLGRRLVQIRRSFLSAPRVRDAYLGYAQQQFVRLTNKGRFPDVPVDRIRKHARHLLRLVETGTHLWATGELVVRVSDPAKYFRFGDRVAEDSSVAESVMARAALTFRHTSTALPDEPETKVVEEWLYDVRDSYYQRR